MVKADVCLPRSAVKKKKKEKPKAEHVVLVVNSSSRLRAVSSAQCAYYCDSVKVLTAGACESTQKCLCAFFFIHSLWLYSLT